MARRRRWSLNVSDRLLLAGGVAVAAVLALGPRFGAVVGAVSFAAIMWPGLWRQLRPKGGATNRPAAAGLASAAAGFLLLGPGHLLAAGLLAAAVAVAVWLWPRWRRYAARTGRRAAPAIRRGGSAVAAAGRGRVRGNHHGRRNVIEEVPTGREGRAKKRGGTGITQVELCAQPNQRAQLVRVANRRYCHGTWTIGNRTPGKCPLDDNKRHWQLRLTSRPQRRN